MSTTAHRHVLPPGHDLLWYRVEEVLGRGSFGVTYLATDTNLDRLVAVKEYLPMELAVREGESSVEAISDDRSHMYRWGLERFLEEARILAKFNHPNIVRVHSVFEANNTAYMAMEYEHGDSLDAVLRPGRLSSEQQLLALLYPLLDAAECMHGAGYIHRDIKPGNIFVRADGSPVLLDFGSTRMALGTQVPALTTFVTHGFAPYEQYDNEHGKQGPWTDIYGLAATMYMAVTGRRPADAIARSNARLEDKPDPLLPASVLGGDDFCPQLLDAIDAGLHLLPKERPQDAAAWRKLLASTERIDTAGRSPTTASIERVMELGDSPLPPGTNVSVPDDMRGPSSVPVRRRASSRTVRRTLWAAVAGAVVLGVAVLAGPQMMSLDPATRTIPAVRKPALAANVQDETAPVEAPQVVASIPAAAPVPPEPGVDIDRPAVMPFWDRLQGGALGPEMVPIDAGGDPGPGFTYAIGRYEVTFDEYDRFVRATGRMLPKDRGWGRGKRPVINVAWDDAVAYAQWLSRQTGERYRLPSAEEWEFAARAGTRTAYWWGDEVGKNRANCNGCGSEWDRNRTAPVGSFEPNALGVYDTAGNVAEWVQDCNSRVSSRPAGAPGDRAGTCHERVYRGGAWNLSYRKLWSDFQTGDGPRSRYSYLGFRVARDP